MKLRHVSHHYRGSGKQEELPFYFPLLLCVIYFLSLSSFQESPQFSAFFPTSFRPHRDSSPSFTLIFFLKNVSLMLCWPFLFICSKLKSLERQ